MILKFDIVGSTSYLKYVLKYFQVLEYDIWDFNKKIENLKLFVWLIIDILHKFVKYNAVIEMYWDSLILIS